MAQKPKPTAPRTKEEQKHLDEMDRKIAELEIWMRDEFGIPLLTQAQRTAPIDADMLADLVENPKP